MWEMMALKPHTTSAVTFLIGVSDWIHNKIQPHILCLLRHFIPQIRTILVNKYESHYGKSTVPFCG